MLIIVAAGMTLVLSSLLSIMLSTTSIIGLPSIGNIRTVGVKAYWDEDLKNQTTNIQWGTVYAGSSYNATLYLESNSNMPTTLQLSVTNWTYINTNNTIASGPSNTTPYLNLTWNYRNQTLNPNQIIQTTLTLTTDNSPTFTAFLIRSNIAQFTMDITITANPK